MRTASEQTSEHGSATRVQGAHTGALMPGALANAYSVLGVRPSAPIQEARAAWLRLVKELHPDAGFDETTEDSSCF
jgi:DnaJ-domain-containing protein 1